MHAHSTSTFLGACIYQFSRVCQRRISPPRSRLSVDCYTNVTSLNPPTGRGGACVKGSQGRQLQLRGCLRPHNTGHVHGGPHSLSGLHRPWPLSPAVSSSPVAEPPRWPSGQGTRHEDGRQEVSIAVLSGRIIPVISSSSSSSSSAFPVISLGFTILGQIFAYMTVFNPTI